MEGSSTGSAQHKIKTINVEVNLLDAWGIQRVDLETKVIRKLLILVSILIASVLILPMLSSFGAENPGMLSAGQSSLADRKKLRSELEKQAKAVAPQIENDTLVTKSHMYSRQVQEELAKIINSTNSNVYFEQMTVDITSGEMTVKVVAHATSPSVGRSFVRAAGQGTNVISSTQTSIKQTPFSESSIKFDYIKRMALSQ